MQRSVFEGFLPEGQLRRLQRELESKIDCEEDSVRIYKFQNLQEAQIEQLGVLSDAQTIVL